MEEIMFSEKELEIISVGISVLIRNARESKKIVYYTDIQNAIDDKIKDYMSLNSKVRSMM